MASQKEINAYKKVLKTIESAQYIHMVNGSVEKLINLFSNIYNNRILCGNLNILFKEKQKQLNKNN